MGIEHPAWRPLAGHQVDSSVWSPMKSRDYDRKLMQTLIRFWLAVLARGSF